MTASGIKCVIVQGGKIIFNNTVPTSGQVFNLKDSFIRIKLTITFSSAATKYENVGISFLDGDFTFA